MKKIIPIIFLGFVLVSCKKTKSASNIKEKDSAVVHEKNEFVVDSITISDSLKISESLTVKYESKMLVFPTLKEKKLLDSIYFKEKGVTNFSKEGIKAYLENEKNNFFASNKKDFDNPESFEWMKDGDWVFYERSEMHHKPQINGFLPLTYFTAAYAGGAHDNYWFSERVVDLENQKIVLLTDITTISETVLSQLLMKNLNKMNTGATTNEGTVDNSDMLLVDAIPSTKNFYFDAQNLYFHYSPYEIAAFAAGDIVIPISWDELKGTLQTDFKKRMNLP